MKGKPVLVVCIGIVAVFMICGVVMHAARAQSAGSQTTTNANGAKKAEEQFKNIQVLKGIAADQMIPAMQFMTTALGVECDFCHVQGEFEKDDKKPKQTARKMMQMMFAINQDNFEGHREVTCYSCHRGSSTPVGTPPVITEETKAMMAEAKNAENIKGQNPEANLPTAAQLFDKYLQAAGGASAIEKVTSRVMKGTITFGDRNVPIDIFTKDPEKRISFTHTPDGDSVTAFDGREGWLAAPSRPVREMHGSDIDAAAMDADLHFPEHLKTMLSEVQVRGTEKIGEHDAYVVHGQRAGKTPLELYFDTKSGLLLRLIRYGDTPLGRLPTQIDYAGYREVGSVKIPYRWTSARTSGRFTIQISDVKQNVPVDDAKFAKPVAEQNGPAK